MAEQDKILEYSPLREFRHIARFWWLIAVCMLIGAAIGYGFHILHPPIYEATATFFVTVDPHAFEELGITTDQYQYNEDLALGTAEGALIAPETLNAVFVETQAQGFPIQTTDLLANGSIERKHTVWELHYRDADAARAQKITDIWAEKGYATMLEWHTTNSMAKYVTFEPPTPALLADHPVNDRQNYLILAGSMIGFVIATAILGMRQNP